MSKPYYNYYSGPSRGSETPLFDVPVNQIPYDFHRTTPLEFNDTTQITASYDYKRTTQALFTVLDDDFKNGKATIWPEAPLGSSAYGPYYATRDDIVADLGWDSLGMYHWYLVKITIDAAYLANLWDAGAYQFSINTGGSYDATFYIYPLSWRSYAMDNATARVMIGDLSTITYHVTPSVDKLTDIQSFTPGALPGAADLHPQLEEFNAEDHPLPPAVDVPKGHYKTFKADELRTAGASDGDFSAHFDINEMYRAGENKWKTTIWTISNTGFSELRKSYRSAATRR